MQSLDILRDELETLGPQVEAADAEILAALEAKTVAYQAHEEAKTEVRRLKAIRDPLRVQQMELQRVVGDLDPVTPPSQVISNGDPDVQVITNEDVAVVNLESNGDN